MMKFAQAPNGLKLAYQVQDFTDPWRNAPYVLTGSAEGPVQIGLFWARERNVVACDDVPGDPADIRREPIALTLRPVGNSRLSHQVKPE